MEAREHYGNCQGLGVGPMSDRCRSCWAWRKPEWNLGQTRSQLNAVAKDTGKCVNSQLSSSFSCFFPMIFMYFPLSKCAFRSLLSTLPFVSCWRRSIPCWPGRRMARWPPKWMTCSAPRSSGALTSLRRMRPTSSNDIGKTKGKKKAYNVYIVAICCNMLQWFVCDTLLQIFACDLCNDIVRRLSYLQDLACRM